MPVEFHHSITQGKLIMTLTIYGNATKIQKSIEKYMEAVTKHLPEGEAPVKILIATGHKDVTW